MTAPQPRRTATLVALLVILCAGGAFRFLRFSGDVFLPGRILPFDPDSSYHLWRIDRAARDGAPPHFDPFLNAPQGAHVIWPDGFDGALGVATRLIAGVDAPRTDREMIALVAVPLLGLLALLAVFALARVAYGRGAALAAAAIAAVLPSHAARSTLGLVDHHVVELLLAPLALAALLAGGGARAARAAGAALCVAGLVWCVPTAALHLGVLAAAAGAAALAAASTDSRARLAVTGAAFALAALFTLPMALAGGGLAFDRPSALPTVLLGAVALVAAGLSPLRGRSLWIGAGVTAVLAAAAAWALRDAAGYIGGTGAIKLVTEAQPLWRNPWDALQMHGALLPAVPVALVALAWRRGPAAWGLAAAGLVGFVLAVMQARFETLLSPAAAAAIGAALVAVAARVRPALRAGVGVAALASLVPSALWWRDATLLTPASYAVLEASDWLAAHTPPTGERAPGTRPPYTILTLWGVGNHYAYLANRPVLAGGFHHGEYAPGVTDAIAALYAGGDPGPILARREVRYAVIQHDDDSVERVHRQLLGLGPAAQPTLHRHLDELDGSAAVGEGGTLPARGDLRLVHDSPVPADDGLPILKIFERVRGAVVVGSCAGERILGRVRVRSDAGRAFDWIAAAPCAGGAYELRVPYPGRLELSGGGAAEVTGADVAEGRQVQAP